MIWLTANLQPHEQLLRKLDTTDRKTSAMVDAESSKEDFFGEIARKRAPVGTTDFSLCEAQHLSMELYEGRIASMQRFVAMTVMFHEMGLRVQRFFPNLSFGALGYRMDRTHSIMRIATTASPVSGSDVRERMESLKLMGTISKAVNVIGTAWHKHRSKEAKHLLRARSMGMLEVMRKSLIERDPEVMRALSLQAAQALKEVDTDSDDELPLLLEQLNQALVASQPSDDSQNEVIKGD